MAQGRRPKKKETTAAQIILRSASGRSMREVGAGSPPSDLTPFRPTEAASSAVTRFLQERGFQVHRDDLGLTISIEGPPSLFKKTFGVTVDPTKISATETIRLPPPKEIGQFVDEILIVPKPEYF
jgi:hypothetical protein